MTWSTRLGRFAAWLATLVGRPRDSVAAVATLTERLAGADVATRWRATARVVFPELRLAGRTKDDSVNPLQAYAERCQDGPRPFKWLHYFDLYHRHLQKFVGRPVTVVEIGVYKGASLSMWKHYFGRDCRVHGVDIRPECRAYEDDQTSIHIGDQADRDFWRRFKALVPSVDVLIDDGGHRPIEQIVTLEEMLPHLNAGGVYICEDVVYLHNPFAAFGHALADELNAVPVTPPRERHFAATPFQAAIDSVHFYPFVVVVEKRTARLPRLETLDPEPRSSGDQPAGTINRDHDHPLDGVWPRYHW
jgi:hypothetical protein